MPLRFLVVLIVIALCVSAEAQQGKQVPRIGLMGSSSLDCSAVDAFRQGVRDLGYVEGKNIIIEYRFAEGKPDRFPNLAADLIRLKVDLIVAQSNPAIIALKQATSTIPIVMTVVADPVGAGFIDSFARPGRNITGLTSISEDLSGKRLELLKEINPKMTRVAVVRNPTNTIHAVF